MSGICVRGVGAVSPAGWSAKELYEFLESNKRLEPEEISSAPGKMRLRGYKVPQPLVRPSFLSHPRMRRAGKLSQYIIAPALEAIGTDLAAIQAGRISLGVITCLMAGNVNYSRQFYQEVLSDPSAASPLLFPETVFNAPASHLSVILNSNGPANTLLGDEGTFILGVAMASHWILTGKADACVVLGGEEKDWIVSEANSLFSRESITSEGGGALYLSREESRAGEVLLESITDAFPFQNGRERLLAAKRMRQHLPADSRTELVLTSEQGVPRLDNAESIAWKSWPGNKILLKSKLGQAFTASTAWQCVVGCLALKEGRANHANVSVVGCNQQAIGARFTRDRPS